MELTAVREFVWTFVLPAICLFGVVTNLVNVAVFSHNRRYLQNRMHVYFLIDSSVESCYLAIGLVYFVLKMTMAASASPALTYWVALYERFVYLYTATSLAFFMIFLKIFISLKRMLVVFNRPVYPLHLNKRRIIVGLFLFSFLIDTPLMLSLRVVVSSPANASNQTTSSTPVYRLSYRIAETTPWIQTLLVVSFAVRGLVAPAILLFVNLMIMKKISRKLSTIIKNRRRTLKKSKSDFEYGNYVFIVDSICMAKSQLRRNLTKMIVANNFLFIVGNFSIFMTGILGTLLTVSSHWTRLSALISNPVLFLSHGCAIFVYYNYNQLFKDNFNEMFLHR